MSVVARSLAVVALVFATGCAGALGPVEFSEGSSMKGSITVRDDSRRELPAGRKWTDESTPRRSYGEGASRRGNLAFRGAGRGY